MTIIAKSNTKCTTMTDTARVARIYVISIALLVSVLIWNVVAATPLPG